MNQTEATNEEVAMARELGIDANFHGIIKLAARLSALEKLVHEMAAAQNGSGTFKWRKK
jgi:hypothetical protein